MYIPEHEIDIAFSRSSGKGGQNVNKVESRVQASWNVDLSHVFTYEQKQLIKSKLANRLSNNGYLMVEASSERSQSQNREQAIVRLRALVQKALHKAKKRIPTKATYSSKLKRLTKKRKISLLKSSRKFIDD